jgi:hypothetical protein
MSDTTTWARSIERAIADVQRDIRAQNEAFAAGLDDWGSDVDVARFDAVTRFSPGPARRFEGPTRGLRRA